MPPENVLLDVKAVATRLGVSEKTVRREIKRGALAAERVGRSVRIDPTAVEAYRCRGVNPEKSL